MLKSLQVYRGVAAALVVLFHTSGSIFALPKYFDSQPFGPLFDFGYAGVDLFFVLSGFIIWKVHGKDVGQPAEWTTYLGKRLRRIYPPYWVLLTLLVPIYFLVPTFGTGNERQIDHLVCSYLLLPHPTSMPILSVAWSLVFELFFYGMFSLLILNRWLGGLAFAAWIGLVALKPSSDYPWTFLSHAYHWEFLLGMATSMLVERVRLPWPGWIAALGASICLGFGLHEVYLAPNLGPRPSMAFKLGGMLILAGATQHEQRHGVAVPGFLTFLGDASYSIYLVHMPALSVLAKVAVAGRVDRFVPHAVLFVLLACGAIAVGCLFHLLVEKPLVARSRKLVLHAPTPAL